MSNTVRRRQEKQKERHDRHVRFRRFEVGQSEQLRPVTYLVDASGGRFWKRHVDHLKEFRLPCPPPTVASEPEIDVDISLPPTSADTVTPEPPTECSADRDEPSDTTPQPESIPEPVDTTPESIPSNPRRYPSRTHHPPERYGV